MQSFNYHTHTYRCGHAVGTEEDMILAAIKGGFKTIGLSDHLPFKNWEDETCRMPLEDFDEYLNISYALKEKYKDQINVLVGVETEFFYDHIDYYKQISTKCDYLIFGQHNKDFNSLDYYAESYCNDENIDYMCEQLIQAVKLGLTKYICHIDYFLLAKAKLTSKHLDSIRKLAKVCKEHDAVMEINLKGTVYGKEMYNGRLCYKYPNYFVMQVLAEEQVKVCFGYDAHNPEKLVNREIENIVFEELKDLNLNYIKTPFI